MTSNLVSMDISSDQEVNNNNQEKAGGCSSVGIDPALKVFNRKEAAVAAGKQSCSPGPASSTCSTSSSSCSVYSLNDTFRIKVATAEEWLCVARMPRDFTQTEFESLLDEFGPIQQCFLIHSEISGTSKGYGLVKYASKASSIQARHVLEGYQVRDGHTLDCNWLQHNRPTSGGGNVEDTTSLHSKCLFVDQLPADYRDMAQFRRLFSKVVNPPYCQIAIKNGVIHNWGLVEYQTSQDAEATMQALEGETIDGHQVRVQFCIPGVHAINIYMAFVNNPMDAVQEKKALLEEAPSSKVYDQLNSLAKHNPWFVANLTNIMASSTGGQGGGSGGAGGQHAGGAPPTLPPHKLESLPPSSDPAQAALILLLAGKVAQGPPDQTTTLLQGIVKQMSNGVNATEILRGIIKPQHNEDVIQTAIKMASLPSAMARSASEAKSSMNSSSRSCATITVTNAGSSCNQNTNDKCPLLMEMLYKSFQARLAKENRLKALQQISEHQHHAHEKSSSSLKPNHHHHSSAISALVAAAATAHATVPTSHAVAAQAAHQVALLPGNANQTLATSAHYTTATNTMEATVNPFPMSNPELMAAAAAAAALNQQQAVHHHAAVAAPPPHQPQPPPPPPQQHQPSLTAASYPLFSYYMNPMWASTAAAQYFQHPATQSLMIPNLMQLGPTLTSQMAAATAGVKRAAAPVLYPTSGALEKRMKLA